MPFVNDANPQKIAPNSWALVSKTGTGKGSALFQSLQHLGKLRPREAKGLPNTWTSSQTYSLSHLSIFDVYPAGP